MFSLLFFIYIADRIEAIADLFGMASFAAIAVLGLSAFAAVTAMGSSDALDTRVHQAAIRWIKFAVVSLLITSTVRVVLPSQKAVYMLGGTVVASQIVDSEVGHKVRELIISKLDDFTEKSVTDTATAAVSKVEQKVNRSVETVNGIKKDVAKQILAPAKALKGD